jgi:Na+-driven multidrug efflux pump
MRIPLAMLFSKQLGLDGIWFALTISSVCKGIAMHIAFKQQFVFTKRISN